MLRSILLAGAAASASLAVPALAATRLTDYAVQTSGDYSTRGGDDVYGRIAVGGNVNANADRIGTHLGAADRNSPALIVGGDLNYANSTLAQGDVVYGGSNTSPRYNLIATPNGRTYQATPVDFARLDANALTLSQGLARLATDGSFTSQWGAGTLTATHSGLNVFSMTASQFNGLYQLNFVGQAGDSAIINILGSTAGSMNFNLGNFDVGSVLFNFVDATSVQSNGIDWKGSILAPNALVSLNGGAVEGSVVSAGFSASGATVRGDAFGGVPALAPASPSAVPEPATWATMIAGFALVGFGLRRRRRRQRFAAA